MHTLGLSGLLYLQKANYPTSCSNLREPGQTIVAMRGLCTRCRSGAAGGSQAGRSGVGSASRRAKNIAREVMNVEEESRKTMDDM
jgi:hypothetical protein